MEGFFPESTLISKAPLPLIPRCGLCQLYQNCKSPKMPVSGEGRKKILICGEAPGEKEDDEGLQFVGKTGQLLMRTLWKLGIARNDCWYTNALICRPEKNVIDDENKIAYCQPNLLNSIKQLEPETVILLGGIAVKSLLTGIWKEDDIGGIQRWAGHQIPYQKGNYWICPTFHPSFVSRMEENPNVERFFEQHLSAAIDKQGRPWKTVPDYKSQIEPIFSPDKAAKAIRSMILMGRPCAFDYETDRLKPDAVDSRIVCCSISNGRRTIAYPWHGEAVLATYEFLRSDIWKIGASIKFEERWTLKEFGKGVRNWLYDGMIGGHVRDNRRKTCSVKFQAFVYLGLDAYNDHIEPFLKSDGGGNTKNRIHEIDLGQLLIYCGIDSLVEYGLAEIHAEQFQIEVGAAG